MPYLARIAANLAVAALGLGLALPGPAVARDLKIDLGDTTPALSAGQWIASCEEIDKDAFNDIGRGECWKCPDGTIRNLNAVNKGKACTKPGRTVHAPATIKKTPILKKCASGYKRDPLLGCYQCPDGYGRNLRAVDDDRACSKHIKATTVAAELVAGKGWKGCPGASWRHGLTKSCYTCPDGYGRNLNIGEDPSKFQACTRVTTTEDAAAKARAEELLKRFSGAEQRLAATLKSFSERDGGDARVPVVVTGQSEADRDRIQLMKDQIETEKEAESGLDTITLTRTIEGSFVAGAGTAWGFSMVENDAEDGYVCHKISQSVFIAGFTFGASVGWELSGFTGTIDDVAGESNGYQFGAGVFAGIAVGGFWAVDSENDDVGITAAFFRGGDAAMISVTDAYVHGWTEDFGGVDCEKLTWGEDWERVR
ncbi:hypothetical protein [Roseivivax sp. CAU 1753]